MYNIIQLNDKDLSELQSIAKELGIKKTDSLKKEDLVYKILDEQAIVGATKKVAAEKAMFSILYPIPSPSGDSSPPVPGNALVNVPSVCW